MVSIRAAGVSSYSANIKVSVGRLALVSGAPAITKTQLLCISSISQGLRPAELLWIGRINYAGLFKTEYDVFHVRRRVPKRVEGAEVRLKDVPTEHLSWLKQILAPRTRSGDA